VMSCRSWRTWLSIGRPFSTSAPSSPSRVDNRNGTTSASPESYSSASENAVSV
jgi:hypothetical protein